MKKIIYIIPGLGENCNLKRYRLLSDVLEKKGYVVNPVNPNWYRPLSEQVFIPEKNSIIFGFSFGAIIAYLIAEKYLFKKVIFGSISPIHEFSFKSLVEDYSIHMPKNLAEEISRGIKDINISFDRLKTQFVTIAGQRENVEAQYLVSSTGHKINDKYIDCIATLV